MKGWNEVAPAMSEADLQRLVTDAASALGWQWVHFRPAVNRRGHWSTPAAGTIGTGWPDVFLARPRDGRLLAVECKRQAGRVTPEQAAVHDVLRACGLDVRVVRPGDLDGLLEALR